jgi:release factor glutamine methyltransferase
MTAPKRVREVLAGAVATLRPAGVDSPQTDARVIMASVLGVPLSRLDLSLDTPLSADTHSAFRARVQRRAKREPLAYVTGDTEFMGLPFLCDARALVPRPETEVLVEQVLERLQAHGRPGTVLDLAAGSGAIGLSLAALLPDSRVVLTDVSERALALARENATRLKVEDRVRLLPGEYLKPVCRAGLAEEITCLVSNPPYVAAREVPQLPPEVALYEPREAWFGEDEDGAGFYRRVAPDCARRLPNLVLAAFEVGRGQARTVAGICAASWPAYGMSVVRDLSGIERVVIAEAPGG